MKKNIGLFLAIIILVIISQVAATENNITINVIEINIKKIVYGADNPDGTSDPPEGLDKGQARFSIYGISKSAKQNTITINDPYKYIVSWGEWCQTMLTLAASGGENRIIGINDEKSIVESFTDDTGKNLLTGVKITDAKESQSVKAAPRKPGAYMGAFNFERINTSDYNVRVLRIRAPFAPAPDARKIHLKGKVFLRMSKTKKTYNCKNVRLVEGEVFKAGESEFNISIAEHETGCNEFYFPIDHPRDEWASSPNGLIHIQIRGDRDMMDICSLAFRNNEGKKIPVKWQHHEEDLGFEHYHKSIEALILGYPSTADIDISLWEDVKEVEVPVDIEVGLDLNANSKKQSGGM